MELDLLNGNMVGIRLSQICYNNEGWHLNFDSDLICIIYNECQMPHPELLLGGIICSLNWKDEMLTITIENDNKIIIDMSDSAYRGPEAFQIILPDGAIIVQN